MYAFVRVVSDAGAVFRRDDRGAISGSSSGVGTGSSTISWQGYEVTTGNISSQNIQGPHINKSVICY